MDRTSGGRVASGARGPRDTGRSRWALVAVAAGALLVVGVTGIRIGAVGGTAAPASAAGTTTAAGSGQPQDPNIAYVGRWDTSTPSFFTSMWTGAYVEVGFTGTTVRLRQRGVIDLWAGIDGGAMVGYPRVSGTVDLTPVRLVPGRHVLRVSYRAVAGSYHGDAGFGGVQLDAGATTFAPVLRPRLIEFVGDSITVGQLTSQLSLTSYPWLVAESLGAEHTQIAQGGACLVATADGCVGLETAFLRTGSAATSPAWDFRRYQPDAVVINLGTNDAGHRVSSVEFRSRYEAFLRLVRDKYPAAHLYALQTFRNRYVAQTRAAVDAVRAGGDLAVTFVPTDGWITTADTVDGVHPDDNGHRKIATRLAAVLSAG